jgi:hypothetical protein
MQLLASLWQHVHSGQYNQGRWCGTNCCLSGAAGLWVENQSLGVAVIATVLPLFNLAVLYSSDRDRAIAELERCFALYAQSSFNLQKEMVGVASRLS